MATTDNAGDHPRGTTTIERDAEPNRWRGLIANTTPTDPTKLSLVALLETRAAAENLRCGGHPPVDDPNRDRLVVELEATRRVLDRAERIGRKLLDAVGDMVLLVDSGGELVWVAPGRFDYLGHHAVSWTAADLWNLVHEDDRDRAMDTLTALAAEPGARVDTEVRVQSATGDWEVLNLTLTNLLDDPDVGSVVIAVRAITTLRAHTDDLERRRAEAEAVSSAKSEYVANVTHEIRTPLHAILGLAELLAASDLGAEEARLADSVRREAANLRDVIDGILDFSRMEAGHTDLHRAPFSPAAVADRVAQLLRPEADRTGLPLMVTVDPRVPRAVVGDEARVRQVLVNLLNNAIKYTRHGRIDLRVDVGTAGELRFEVADTGRGIAAADLERMFEPFTQGRAEDAGRGTGLGLAISRRIVDLMGGRIDVASEPGVGSSFTVTIPAQTATPDGAIEDEPPRGGAVAAARVLVVEDDAVNRMLASGQLDRLGHRAVLAPDGEQALDLLTVERFDLVLMDWYMPGMDGLECTRRWREMEPEGRHVPVIAMTASAADSDREACLAAGMDDFLPKPVSIHDLAAMLDRWLGRRTLEGDGMGAGRDGGEPAGAAVDDATIDALVEDLGDARLVASVIGTYLSELPERCRTIADALTTGDVDVIRRAAHTLKSTSATVGAHHLAELCAELERRPEQPPDRGPVLIARLESQTTAVRTELARRAVSLNAEPMP